VASKIIVIVRTSHVKCSSLSILIAIERKQRCSARSFFRKVRTRTVGLGRTGVVFEFDSLSKSSSANQNKFETSVHLSQASRLGREECSSIRFDLKFHSRINEPASATKNLGNAGATCVPCFQGLRQPRQGSSVSALKAHSNAKLEVPNPSISKVNLDRCVRARLMCADRLIRLNFFRMRQSGKSMCIYILPHDYKNRNNKQKPLGRLQKH